MLCEISKEIGCLGCGNCIAPVTVLCSKCEKVRLSIGYKKPPENWVCSKCLKGEEK